MPEGPEVKIASDYFNDFFKNSQKIKFEILTDYYHNKYKDVFDTINKNIDCCKETYTIGKNIFIDLNNKSKFNFHLGMTGGWNKTLIKHCHFRVFNEKKELFFKDVRKFGKMKIISQAIFEEKFNPTYDLMHKSYNIHKHLNFLNSKINIKKSICSVIMDQKYFPGVGNYIKSESLYESKLHPEIKWGNIKKNKKIHLIQNIKKVMQSSYNAGGAELKDFNNPFKKSKFKLKIYGKKYTEKNNLVTNTITSDYRKTWFCSKEQKK